MQRLAPVSSKPSVSWLREVMVDRQVLIRRDRRAVRGAAILERRYAAYVSGSHDRIAGVLDAASRAPTPRKGEEHSPVDARATSEAMEVA